MYQKLIETIENSVLTKLVNEDRKIVLHPLIDYIQDKIKCSGAHTS